MKTTNKTLFLTRIWKDFPLKKTHSIKSRCVIGPKYILFAGASVHLSAQKFYMLGQWRGWRNASKCCHTSGMSVWVIICVDLTIFTRTPVTVCRCEWSSEWILPLSQGHQWLVLGQHYVNVSAYWSGFYLFHKDTSDCCSTIHGSQVKRGPVFNPSWDGGQELAAANQHLHHSAQTSISTVISIHKDNMYCWWPLSICTYLQQHGKCMRY